MYFFSLIFESIIFVLILFLISLGWGKIASNGYFINKNNSSDDWIIDITLGISILSLLATWYLYFNIYSFYFTVTISVIGFVIGLISAFNYMKSKSFSFQSWDNYEKFLLFLISAILLSHFIRMLTPSGCQESFQYHYYLPKLYTEQQSLFLSGYELHDAILNAWGYEVLLSLAYWFGGIPKMTLTIFFLFFIFICQVYRSTILILEDRKTALLAILMVQFSSVYVYFMWWTKPELVLTGIFLMIYTLISTKSEREYKFHENAILLTFMLSLKMTSAVLIPLFLFLCFYHKLNIKWLLKSALFSLLVGFPWAVYLLSHQGGLGGLPTHNPDYFDGPNALGFDNSPYQTIPKYFSTLISYCSMFKPSFYIFAIGIPYFLFKWKKYYFLIIGLLFNYILAAIILTKGMMYYGDEFRYICFTLVVLPIGAAVIAKLAFNHIVSLILLLCLTSYISYKRIHVSLSESFRYYSGYLYGEKKLNQVLTREGGDHFNFYNENKQNHDILFHIGHGNIVVDGKDVIHVGSWSKRYPVWKYKTKEDLIHWLKSMNVTWVLFESMRYSVYARGFGGPQYSDSPESQYYVESIKSINLLSEYEIKGLPSNYKLYKLPD